MIIFTKSLRKEILDIFFNIDQKVYKHDLCVYRQIKKPYFEKLIKIIVSKYYYFVFIKVQFFYLFIGFHILLDCLLCECKIVPLS